MIATTIITEIILKKKRWNIPNIAISALSTVAKSFENLVSILPDGFESKKAIGAFKSTSHILLWIFFAHINI